MAFSEFLDRVETLRQSTSITIYAPEPLPELSSKFESDAIDTGFRRLPTESDEGFLTIYVEDTFRATIDLEHAREFLEPPIYHPWDETSLDIGYAFLLEALDNTLVYSLERRQLLGASREIEHRAWQTGSGTLRVGFQRLSAFEPQLPVYDRLSRDTDLEIHVFGRSAWSSPISTSVLVHSESAAEIGRFWFLVYDGGDDPHSSCALLAEEREPGEYVGFWTYDTEFVDEIGTYIRDIYG